MATIGIYVIRNTVNGKRYVGKSVNIERRTRQHFTRGSRSGKGSRHLTAALNKYGVGAFVIEIVETFDVLDNDKLAERELHWMDVYNTCDRAHGYNLMRNSDSSCVIHPETKALLSIKQKLRLADPKNHPRYGVKLTEEQRRKISESHLKRYAEGAVPHMRGKKLSEELRNNLSSSMRQRWASGEFYTDETIRKQCENRSKYWQNNPDAAKLMGERVSESRSIYRFCKVDPETDVVLQCWDTMLKLIKDNPGCRSAGVYDTCDGYQKTHRGFKWIKELKDEKAVDL